MRDSDNDTNPAPATSPPRAPDSDGAVTRREFLGRTAMAGVIAAALPRTGLLRPFGGTADAATGGPRAPAMAASWMHDPALVARVRIDGDEFSIGNDKVAATWSIAGGQFKLIRVDDKSATRGLGVEASAFALVLRDRSVVQATELKLLSEPGMGEMAAQPGASRFSDRVPGKVVTLEFEDATGKLRIGWRAILRDGSTYVRQEIAVHPVSADIDIAEVRMLHLSAPGAKVVGTVDGSPVVAGNFYFGLEDPLSKSVADDGRVMCWLPKGLPLRAGNTMTCSSVIGVVPEGQLRRSFLRYVERERAHPYRTFLHYNTWYDLGYFTPFAEKDALAVIRAYGEELHNKRGVTLDSFLFDDGWDDHRSLWRFNDGFPNGFTPVRAAAAKYGSAPGVWMSPWGGYGKPKEERIAFGKAQGFETNEGGFALSGPVYYARFRETCLTMIRTYGVNQFKFDGTGNADRAFPGSAFGSDFEAAINLIGELRREKPDLYVNLTTGTYPSPFWLRTADSIWRGGEDHDFAGVGSDRQQWITYRDGDTFAGVVSKGPLYPVNSLMLHGLIYAQHARKLNVDPRHDFRSEVHDYFGTGTQLQEMYVTPGLLSPADWDAIAEAAKWSRRNADVLVDTHWIGGDPAKLEPYGWASWSDTKAIVTLRNPSDKPATFELDAQTAFELPAGARRDYSLRSPWRSDRGKAPLKLTAGAPTAVKLAPFEVLNLERRE